MTIRHSLPHLARTACVVLAIFATGLVVPAMKGDVNDLTTNGNAQILSLGIYSVLQLTSAERMEAGSIFSKEPVVFDDRYRFHTFFQFFFMQPGGIGAADGITFTIQTEGANALGGTGGALGYGGITPSIGVSFVTFQNTWDISDNSVGVVLNGNYMAVDQYSPYDVTGCQPPTGIFGCMGNGDVWSVWIDYDGEYLKVAIADNSNKRPLDLIKYPIDIASLLGEEPAFVGFTGATGNGIDYHRVKSWIFVPDPKRWGSVPGAGRFRGADAAKRA